MEACAIGSRGAGLSNDADRGDENECGMAGLGKSSGRCMRLCVVPWLLLPVKPFFFLCIPVRSPALAPQHTHHPSSLSRRVPGSQQAARARRPPQRRLHLRHPCLARARLHNAGIRS